MARKRVVSRIIKMCEANLIYVKEPGSVDPQFIDVVYPEILKSDKEIQRYLSYVYDLPDTAVFVSMKQKSICKYLYLMPEEIFHKYAVRYKHDEHLNEQDQK